MNLHIFIASLPESHLTIPTTSIQAFYLHNILFLFPASPLWVFSQLPKVCPISQGSSWANLILPSPRQRLPSPLAMAIQTLVFAAIAVAFFAIRYLNQTDVAKIKNLPEIPGVPIFGNLLQLGTEHAKVAGEWAKKYGPVFQVRMGNRVRIISPPHDQYKTY